MTTLGIDVSGWQRPTPSLTGLDFLFAKATEGTGFRDPMYATHIAAANKAKLVVGAYHFGIGGSGADQARHFLDVAGNVDVYALDLERPKSAPPMTQAEARIFIATVKAAGHKCGLYTSDSGFPSLGQDWNWIAKWGAAPPARKWTIWQYADTPFDLDQFNGDRAALLRFAGRTPAPIPPPEDPNVRVVTVTIETFPARTFTSAGSLRRFSATAEMKPIPGPYTATVDGDVVISGNTSAPTGSGFYRLAAGGSAGRYILAAAVTLEA